MAPNLSTQVVKSREKFALYITMYLCTIAYCVWCVETFQSKSSHLSVPSQRAAGHRALNICHRTPNCNIFKQLYKFHQVMPKTRWNWTTKQRCTEHKMYHEEHDNTTRKTVSSEQKRVADRTQICTQQIIPMFGKRAHRTKSISCSYYL